MNAKLENQSPVLVSVAQNPVPEGAKVRFLETSDKIRLRYAIWPKTDGPSRGTICLVHGRSEFIEKYYETIADFTKRGFQVATFDWRGQGGSQRLLSDPTKGHVKRFNEYWTDLSDFHASVLLPDCPPPYYLVGHSTGAMVGLHAVVRDRLMFERVFLTSPLLSIDDLPLNSSGMATLFEFGSMIGLGGVKVPGKRSVVSAESFPGNVLTSDFERYMRSVYVLEEAPHLGIGRPTIGWAAAASRAAARASAPDFPDRINLPVFLLAAARDEVVSTRAIEHLGLRMRTGRHTVIAKSRHEMFMESDEVRGQVFAAFDAFITNQSGN